MGELKQRHEVDQNYTWDLTPLFESDAACEDAIEHINGEISGFVEKYEGRLGDVDTAVSAIDDYRQLVEKLQPHEYTMRTNYRSYQQILDAASVYLKNPEEASVSAESVMTHEPKDYVKIVQWQKGMKYWTDELPELVREAQESLATEHRHQRFEYIAVFFRSND